MTLSKEIFWDIDMSTLNYEVQGAFILERVITRGTISDFKQIVKYYGIEALEKIAIDTKNLDKKSLNFISFFLNIPKYRFKCYSQIQSLETHWNY